MRRLAVVLALAACASPGVPTPASIDPRDLVTDTALLVINPRRVYPTPVHAAVWQMVASCIEAPRTGLPIAWMVADSLIGDPSGRVYYAKALETRDPQLPLVVLVERPYVHNVMVVSHELGHLLGGTDEGHPNNAVCTIQNGTDLPARYVTQAELPALRQRAAVVR